MKEDKKEKLRIYLKAYDYKLLDVFAKKIMDIIVKSGSKVSGPIPLPTKIKKYTVIRSPHINKSSREQFEMRIHKRMLEVLNSNAQTLASLSSFSLPSGVGIEVKQK